MHPGLQDRNPLALSAEASAELSDALAGHVEDDRSLVN